MKKYIFIMCIGGLFLFSGCYVKQNIEPVESVAKKDICIIKDIHDEHDIAGAYTRALQAKGYNVTIKKSTDPISVCPLTTNYYVSWGFDKAVYLSYLHLIVYQNGKAEGEALYDVKGGWASKISKYTKAEDTVADLVSKLYP
jgi:hypothetical protein